MNVAATCIVVLAVAFVAALLVLPRTGKAQTLSVLTGSMSPSIPAGSLVFVEPVDPSRINVGEVITFHPRSNSDALVTHRVVGFVFGTEPKLSFRTKGDANTNDDPDLVPDNAVVGKVVHHLPYLGYLSTRAEAKAGLVLIAGLSIPLLFGGSSRQTRRRRQPATDIPSDVAAAAGQTR